MAGRKRGFMPATVIDVTVKKLTRAMATIALEQDKALASGKARFVPADFDGDHPEKPRSACP